LAGEKAINSGVMSGLRFALLLERLSEEKSHGGVMNILKNQSGKIGWILLWALGIPIPVLFILFLVRGCT
jgi:hypothetical protein